MSFRTKINPPNDFEMSIVGFPPEIEDFNSLQFPEMANAWAVNPKQKLQQLAHQYLQEFDDVQTFINAQIINNRIAFIKVDPANEPKNGNCAYYICFGNDPDSLENSISFRIDQEWTDFDFPKIFGESTIDHLKLLAQSLSGAIIGRLDFPELILSKEWIGKPEICYGYDRNGKIVNSDSIQKAMRDYFLLSLNYWGIATIIDKLGLVWLWNTRNQKDFEIQPTGLNLKKWYQAELQNPFRQHLEPK